MGIYGSCFSGLFLVSVLTPYDSLTRLNAGLEDGTQVTGWYETELGTSQKIDLINTPLPNGPCAQGTQVEFAQMLDSLILSCSGFNGTQLHVKQVLVRSHLGWHIRQKLKFIKMAKTVVYTEPEPIFYHKRSEVGGRVDPRSKLWSKGPGQATSLDNKTSQVVIDENLFPPLQLPEWPNETEKPNTTEEECKAGKRLKDSIGGCAIEI